MNAKRMYRRRNPSEISDLISLLVSLKEICGGVPSQHDGKDATRFSDSKRWLSPTSGRRNTLVPSARLGCA